VRRHGGVSNRPGTKYIDVQKDSSKRGRLLKFVFNDEQTYVLWFEDLSMRVVRDGALVLVSGIAAYGAGTAYVIGDLASSGGVNYYCVAATTGNAPPNTTYWYPLTGSIYEIPTPYVEADLQTLQISQSGDIVTITHRNYAPRDLARTGHTAWTLTVVTTAPSMAAPASPSVAGGTGVGKDFLYKVTAIKEETFEESEPSAAATITDKADPTSAAPNVVTWTAVPGAQEYNVYRQKAIPTTTAGDGIYGYVGTASETTFNDNNAVQPDFLNTPPIPRAPFGDLISQGSWNNGTTTETLSASDNFTLFSTTANDGCIASFTVKPTLPVPINFAVSQIQTGSPVYVVEFWDGAAWTAGTISTAPSFLATGNTIGKYRPAGAWAIAGSGTNVPATAYNVRLRATTAPTQAVQGRLSISGAYPATSGYFQQRKLYASTLNEPEKVWGSRSGAFKNFTIRSPLQDDDAVTFSAVGRKVNEVRHMVEVDDFVLLTSGGEWIVQGDANGVLVPQSPNPKQKTYYGSAEVAPVIIGSSLLYVQARGSIIRDFRKDLVEGTKSKELSIFAPHLFDGLTIEHMDYAQIPNSIVWVTRADGGVIGLTYLPDHDVWGWHRHDTDGDYEDICVVPEGGEDALYWLVNRTINGVVRRSLERSASRAITNVVTDALFLDSFLTYDGRNTGATTMMLSGGTNWTYDETLTLTASVGYFVAGDVDNVIVLDIVDADVDSETYGEVTDSIRLTITAYSSVTVVTGRSDKTVPAGLRAVAKTTWGKAVDEFSGVDHLEAKSIGILADGGVVTNGVDAPLTTVTAGAFSISSPAVVVHAGLPITADFETLDMELIGTETLLDKKKLITSVTLNVEASRGIWAGQEVDHLTEYKQRTTSVFNPLMLLLTGKPEIITKAAWNTGGRVFVRQTNPLPITILSIVPHLVAGG
jgi:hypothetical protein